LDYEPDLNPKLAEIIMKCMEPDPNKRFQTMEDILIQLRQVDKEAEF
jgi:serine/threonine protein kinase